MIDADEYVPTGIEGIYNQFNGDDELFDVYDLSGRPILRQASKYEFERLEQGIYIVNGRKVMVK